MRISFAGEPMDGGFRVPERLPAAINSPGPEFNAMIAPDESYLVFGAWGRRDDLGGGDLYIAFKSEDGLWTDAMNMGSSVNSPNLDYCPAFSPDCRALFFTSNRSDFSEEHHPRTYQDLLNMHQSPKNGSSDIYWIKSTVIDSLRHSHRDTIQ